MTIHKNVTFTLDGHTKFTVGDETFKWNEGWIDLVNIWSGDSGKTYTNTVQLKGHDWGMSTMRFVGDANMKVHLVDLDSGANRFIDFLGLGNAGSTVSLKSTSIKAIEGSDAVDNVTTGTGWTGAISLEGGNDIVHIGRGGVDSIYTDQGNDTVIGATGTGNNCEMISLGDGNNVFTGNNTWVGMLSASNGNDTITVGNGGVDTIKAGDGKNTINVTGSGYVGSILAFQGNDTVNIKGTNSVDSVTLGGGDNHINITGSGWVGDIITNEGDDVIKAIGTHNIGSIVAGTGNNTIQTGKFFVSAITAWEDNDTVTVGAGGVGQIWLYNGANKVTAQGWIGSLLLGNDKDNVTLGSGGAAQVTMYAGADSLSVTQLANKDDIDMFNGGTGVDSISFARFTKGIAISLASANPVDTGVGMFIIHNFENLTTGGGKDTLTGNKFANRLDGGGGDNRLTGGAGADVFVYATSHGDDTVTDFSKAQGDKIDLSHLTGVDSFADLTAHHMKQGDTGTEISDGSGDILLLTGVSMDTLTKSQFIF